MLECGYIHVYTGNGKGKTTAALGLLLRAVGAGLRPCLIQFLKAGESSDVAVLRERLPEVTIYQWGHEGRLLLGRAPEHIDYEAARGGLAQCRQLMATGHYDLIILDEINVALALGLLEEEEILDLMAHKPEQVELVLTGRYATRAIMQAADVVTDMACTKHYYLDRGIPARKGIEW